MSQERAPHTHDRLARLAAQQHGVVTLRQLYSLGYSDSQVRTRVAAGWLHRIHHGVFAVGRRPLPIERHWMAAVLAGGEGAVLSHWAAAQLWRLRRIRSQATNSRGGHSHPPIDITVPSRGGRRRRAGLVIHRVTALPPEERTLHCRIPVTTPARTLLDLATCLPRRQLERAIDEAERLNICNEEDLERIVAAHFGQAGAGVLGAVIREHQPGSTPTRSELEERFLALCRNRRLPQPEVNVPLLDYIVDFLWPEARLVVEVDGRATHDTHGAFQSDRDRDGRLAVAGYRVLRFTWWDVTRRPAVVTDRVRRLLAG
jgi:very-short-patch-repair endonuclease/predicted transcriptional regulator of viral defense system